MNFRNDGGGRNRPATRVSVDESQLLNRKVEFHGVDEKIIRPGGKLFDRSEHGQPCRLIDIDLVDFKYIGHANSPTKRARLNMPGEFLACFSIDDFAVAQAFDGFYRVQDDRSREHRAE